MKRGTSDHWKTLRLARALGCNVPQVLGHLHVLWEWCSGQKPHPDGAVGRYTDAEIERKCQWDGEPGRFVRALLEVRWLDPHADPDLRLLVHDWPDHCEDYVHRAMARACKRFASGRIPKLGGLSAEEKARAQEAFGLLEDRGQSIRTVHGTVAATVARSPAVAVAVAVANERTTPPYPPSAAAEGGDSPHASKKALLRAQEELEAYWRALGGRPNRKDRRKLWEALRAGHAVVQLRGSISELVREDLVTAGKLAPFADWPPDVEVAKPP